MKKKDFFYDWILPYIIIFILVFGGISFLEYKLKSDEDFIRLMLDKNLIKIEGQFGGSYGEILSNESNQLIENQFLIINLDIDNEDLKQAIIHETCHAIWFLRLEYDEIKSYKKIVDNADFFITTYSKLSLEEDFAEHCTAYIFNQEIDKERFEFMEKFI